MDHSHHDHGSSGGSSGGSDPYNIFGDPVLPDNVYMQRMFWAAIGAAIGFATLVNVFNLIIYRQRLAASADGHACPAKPLSPIFKAWATLTAIAREISYETLSIRITKKRTWHSSLPTGPVIVVLSYAVTLIVFCFYKFNLKDQWQWEDVGYRTGHITLCQLPLIFLLAGKKNIIGYLTGSSYERLNWLHRWTARGLFLTATIHMGYWFTSWARFNYIVEKVKTDSITRTGLGAWGVLTWIILSSISPIRGLSYEIFVLQHFISFAGLIAATYLHVPAVMRLWIWIPVGLFAFDRLVRLLNAVYINLSIFRKSERGVQSSRSFWACKAEFLPISDRYTRIIVPRPPISWKPGQHVFLACHSLLPGQSHPFTISSLPSDKKMEFLVRAEKGATKKLFNHAENCQCLPTSEEPTKTISSIRTVAIEGPYGYMRPLEQFDTVTLIAGSTGATFTVPLLRDLVRRWASKNEGKGPSLDRGVVTRRIRFIWVVRNTHQLKWFSEQLESALAQAKLQTKECPSMEINIQFFVTCDETMAGDPDSSRDSIRGKVESTTTKDASSDSEISMTKKNVVSEEKNAVSSSSSSTLSQKQSASKSQPAACGPDGTCCCRTTVSSSSDPQPECCCCNTSSATSSQPLQSISLTSTSTKPPSSIPILTGRPSLPNIIRTELELAVGESAVVVCGPAGLVRDVRRTASRLSDERAVHKGTGALGIWVHGECFGY